MGVSRQIVRLDALPDALAALIAESQQQGFRFFAGCGVSMLQRITVGRGMHRSAFPMSVIVKPWLAFRHDPVSS